MPAPQPTRLRRTSSTPAGIPIDQDGAKSVSPTSTPTATAVRSEQSYALALYGQLDAGAIWNRTFNEFVTRRGPPASTSTSSSHAAEIEVAQA